MEPSDPSNLPAASPAGPDGAASASAPARRRGAPGESAPTGHGVLPLARDLERLTVAAIALTTLALEAAGPEVDLTFPQWRVLVILGEGPDGARIGRVAERVGVTVPATGRLLRRLERRGLVALVEDPDDRRATRARLTGKGDAVRKEIVRTRMDMLKEVAGSVGDPDALTLRDGLASIVSLLEPLS